MGAERNSQIVRNVQIVSPTFHVCVCVSRELALFRIWRGCHSALISLWSLFTGRWGGRRSGVRS